MKGTRHQEGYLYVKEVCGCFDTMILNFPRTVWFEESRKPRNWPSSGQSVRPKLLLEISQGSSSNRPTSREIHPKLQ